VVLFVAEHAIGLGGIVERQGVADDEGGVDFSLLDAFEQRRHVAHHVGLPGLHRKSFVHEGAHGNLVDEACIDTRNRDGATFLAGHDHLSQNDGAIHLQASHLPGAIYREHNAMP
jgi:hypothetical protein